MGVVVKMLCCDALVRKSWSLIKEESTFIDWQRAKVQETPNEVSLPPQSLQLLCCVLRP